MSAWVCRKCTAAYSVGAPMCPECGTSSRIAEAEQNEIEEAAAMAKATVHGGATNASKGGEQPSPTPEGDGSTSSTSSEKEPSSPETSSSAGRSRARTTGSRSKKDRTGTSTAAGTDGGPTAPISDDDDTES